MISRNRIAYFYDDDIGNYYYGESHPMKPVRVRMTHSMILGYGLHHKLTIFHPRRASAVEMMRFHSPEYISSLQNAPLTTVIHNSYEADCPRFANLFEYCQISAGGSITAAQHLNSGNCDIAINWAGGLHHARKDEASGFCYVADCVLGIMELLKYNPRVLYVDIDIHHGDGVEEAFYNTDRVCTVSFHKYGLNFFPETGHVYDVGTGPGKYYSVNVPLRDNITDETYHSIFKPVVSEVIHTFRPTAIMLQCGADSLVNDIIGCWNLSTAGHAECVRFVKSFGIPTLVVGGGGYVKQSVARCWTNETAVICGVDLDDQLPETEYLEYFKPKYQLHLKPENRQNANSPEFIERLRNKVLANIRHLPGAPSVEMQELPPRIAIGRPVRSSTIFGDLSKKIWSKIISQDDLDEEKAQKQEDEVIELENQEKLQEQAIMEQKQSADQ